MLSQYAALFKNILRVAESFLYNTFVSQLDDTVFDGIRPAVQPALTARILF